MRVKGVGEAAHRSVKEAADLQRIKLSDATRTPGAHFSCTDFRVKCLSKSSDPTSMPPQHQEVAPFQHPAMLKNTGTRT